MKKVLYTFLVLFIFVLTLSSCNKNNKDDYQITATAPNGAPAVALATLAIKNKDNYNFISAKTIGTAFGSNESDVVIAPINAGANLYSKGKSTYKLAAVITWGNLFFASQKENFTLDSINGNEITLFGEDTINASLALYVLEKNNITPSKINYLAEASDTQSVLSTDAKAIVMCAEPAITAVKTKKNVTSISLQELYKNASGNDEFAQAGIFVKADTIANHKEALNKFLLNVKAETDSLTTNLDKFAEASVELGILPALPIAKSAIPNCSIKFVKAIDAKDAIEKTAKLNLAQYGGVLPNEEFYYSAF